MIKAETIKPEWFVENLATAGECKKYREQPKRAYLVTTRFNNETYAQNRRFCAKYKYKSLYSNPHPLPASIPMDATVYVIEMNNTIDKIVGIGKFKNRLKYNVYNIYETEFYNQNHFVGEDRIGSEEFQEKDKAFIQSLEQQLFFGRGHLKRGHRMLSFPHAKLGTCMKNGLDVIETIERIVCENKDKREFIRQEYTGADGV